MARRSAYEELDFLKRTLNDRLEYTRTKVEDEPPPSAYSPGFRSPSRDDPPDTEDLSFTKFLKSCRTASDPQPHPTTPPPSGFLTRPPKSLHHPPEKHPIPEYVPEQSLVSCTHCGRKFTPQRVTKHESVCDKSKAFCVTPTKRAVSSHTQQPRTPRASHSVRKPLEAKPEQNMNTSHTPRTPTKTFRSRSSGTGAGGGGGGASGMGTGIGGTVRGPSPARTPPPSTGVGGKSPITRVYSRDRKSATQREITPSATRAPVVHGSSRDAKARALRAERERKEKEKEREKEIRRSPRPQGVHRVGTSPSRPSVARRSSQDMSNQRQSLAELQRINAAHMREVAPKTPPQRASTPPAVGSGGVSRLEEARRRKREGAKAQDVDLHRYQMLQELEESLSTPRNRKGSRSPPLERSPMRQLDQQVCRPRQRDGTGAMCTPSQQKAVGRARCHGEGTPTSVGQQVPTSRSATPNTVVGEIPEPLSSEARCLAIPVVSPSMVKTEVGKLERAARAKACIDELRRLGHNDAAAIVEKTNLY